MSSDSKPEFEPGVLYVVLLHRGDNHSWHCALFLPGATINVALTDAEMPEQEAPEQETPEQETSEHETPEHGGLIFHCTNKNAEDRWTYEVTSPRALGLATRLVLGARLADLSLFGALDDVAESVEQVLRAVHVQPHAHRTMFNCRTWMLAGVAALDDVGFITCEDIDALERELITGAMFAAQKYKEDGSHMMITSRRCEDG
ncbi:hypothetical protein DFH11DRAFT_588100 [Phellopilus nigrolimitatus]|nr:hypothetical protein DFH11DRAFT_588100 [Phellopilus nigrolimitatus]